MSQSLKERGLSVNEVETHLGDALTALDELDESDVRELSDEKLVSLRTTLKELEDETEEARKSVADEEVSERIAPGESLLGLSHIQSHNKYVKEDIQKVVMRAVGKGIDYTEFVSLDASTLASDFPDLADVGEAEYTYIR